MIHGTYSIPVILEQGKACGKLSEERKGQASANYLNELDVPFLFSKLYLFISPPSPMYAARSTIGFTGAHKTPNGILY